MFNDTREFLNETIYCRFSLFFCFHSLPVFENREKMVLVMEFAAGGELYDYLSERKVLTEDEARRIFRQIATAVYYCHKHKICHRDLKLENILLDEHGNAKVSEFLYLISRIEIMKKNTILSLSFILWMSVRLVSRDISFCYSEKDT